MEKENRKCICGKRRANLNNTNWSRHLASCKKVKLSLTSQSVSSFFKKSRSDTGIYEIIFIHILSLLIINHY